MQLSVLLSLLQAQYVWIDKRYLLPYHRLPVLHLQVLRVDAILKLIRECCSQHIICHYPEALLRHLHLLGDGVLLQHCLA